jgi:hypothetical protein
MRFEMRGILTAGRGKGNTLPASVMTTSISEGATRQKERAGCRAASLQVISGSIEWLYPLCIYQQISKNIKESTYFILHERINEKGKKY